MRCWYRNGFYHRHLLRHVPARARQALDVGCGSGDFAARVALGGVTTTGIDLSPTMVDYARERHAGVANLSFQVGDISEIDLPPARYDYISCLASIHHMPFEAVLTRLRDALAPAGVLVVLGLYRTETLADRLLLLAAVPTNALVSGVVSVRRRMGRDELEHTRAPRHPVRPATMSLAEIRAEAARQLPGVTIRRLFFWRYSLVYRHGVQLND